MRGLYVMYSRKRKKEDAMNLNLSSDKTFAIVLSSCVAITGLKHDELVTTKDI